MNHFGDQKKKNIKKIMSRACATLSDFDFSSEDSSSSEEDVNVNHKKKEDDFTGLCLMTKGGSSWNNFDSDFDSDVSDDLTYGGLSSKVYKLEDALCGQEKLLWRVFHENKDLNIKFQNSFVEIASLQLMHNDMSAKPCENCNMIIVNYADLQIVHTQVASELKGAKLELKELKAHSLMLGPCTSCPMLKSDLKAYSIEIKELKQKLDHSSRYKVPTTHPIPSEEVYICMFCGRASHLDGFCFRHKRMEKRRVDYARNSYHDEFIDFLPHFSSCALSHFSHGPNHRSYGFGSQESGFVPGRFDVDPHSHRGVRPPRRHGFPARGVYSHFESSRFDGPHFPRCGSRPTRSNGEVQRIMKTSSGCMVKC
jgi:hypothetical protein